MPKTKNNFFSSFFHRSSSIAIFILSFLIIQSSFVFLPSSFVYAAVPHLINYQGRLTDTSGAPLNGSYSLTFRIYDALTAGTLLWEEKYTGETGEGSRIVIEKGIFSILLGSVTNLNLAFDKPYFLEIKVGDEVMSPRQRIVSAGYALRAEVADEAKTKADTQDITAGYLSDKVDNETLEVSEHKLRVKAPLPVNKGGTGVNTSLIKIGSYTGNSSSISVAHGLGVKPALILVFSESSETVWSWMEGMGTYWRGLGNGQHYTSLGREPDSTNFYIDSTNNNNESGRVYNFIVIRAN